MGKWKTKIAGQVDGKLIIRGKEFTKLVEENGFVEAIYLLLTGKLPDEKQTKMLNAIFVATLEHGMGPPSTTVSRIVASTGNSVNTAVAAGITSMGEYHGGAGEECARLFQIALKSEENPIVAAKTLVEDIVKVGKRMPGYGHAIYDVDPRTQTLLKIAQNLGFKGKFVDLAQEVEKQLQIKTGKKLPLNIDGILAALMLELGLDWRLGRGLFIIGRTPGLVAHVLEEQVEEKPYRRLSEDEIEYVGEKE
ncbi:MAG TPA: citryl-CoA lyase [Patescibacteria group bacterium]